jgi:hypothetical protein
MLVAYKSAQTTWMLGVVEKSLRRSDVVHGLRRSEVRFLARASAPVFSYFFFFFVSDCLYWMQRVDVVRRNGNCDWNFSWASNSYLWCQRFCGPVVY